MPARVCPSLSVLIAPRPTFPPSMVSKLSVQYCLIIFADTREAGHLETSDTPPRLEGRGGHWQSWQVIKTGQRFHLAESMRVNQTLNVRFHCWVLSRAVKINAQRKQRFQPALWKKKTQTEEAKYVSFSVLFLLQVKMNKVSQSKSHFSPKTQRTQTRTIK